LLLLIELGLCVVAVILAFACPRLGDRWFKVIERRASRFAARRGLAVVTILILALGVRLAVLPIEPIPAPLIHDEFSYLLMGDTFAHGRLTNPPHPMWQHFETFHVIWQPTYTSMFYPGQGFFLAIGQAIFGHPFWGVWLSTGLMCAAFCWALQGWMPPGWAFLGGILAVLNIGTFSYWADSYWGGSVAGIGGALVLGAVPRIKRLRVAGSIAMGFGLALLVTTRPYESVFYVTPILLALAAFFFSRRRRVHAPNLMRRVVFPLGSLMLLTVVFLGYYFWRTTGNPFRPPYVVDRQMYHLLHFPWEKPDPNPQFRSAEQAAYYRGFVLRPYNEVRTSKGFAVVTFAKIFMIWQFFVGPILTIPLLALAFALPYNFRFRDVSAKAKLLLITFGVSFVGLLLPIYFLEHYAGPIACLISAIILYAMRTLSLNKRNRGSARNSFCIRSTVLMSVIAFIILCSVLIRVGRLGFRLQGLESRMSILSRGEIANTISVQPGKHLVLVQYAPNHNYLDEWVYNEADINDSKIVWAHEMGPDDDNELLSYFKDRKVWLVDADEFPVQLRQYSTKLAAGVEQQAR
jgi:hypothetical protein